MTLIGMGDLLARGVLAASGEITDERKCEKLEGLYETWDLQTGYQHRHGATRQKEQQTAETPASLQTTDEEF